MDLVRPRYRSPAYRDEVLSRVVDKAIRDYWLVQVPAMPEKTKTSQLAQRARTWRARWNQTVWPQATHTILLWNTDKGFARLEAIWSAWTQHALPPAFFTTVETLSLGTGGLWHPWNPRRHLPDSHRVWVWHDMWPSTLAASVVSDFAGGASHLSRRSAGVARHHTPHERNNDARTAPGRTAGRGMG